MRTEHDANQALAGQSAARREWAHVLRRVKPSPKPRVVLRKLGIIAALGLLLAGCGGGSEPLDSHGATTLPVRCTVAGVSGTCT